MEILQIVSPSWISVGFVQEEAGRCQDDDITVDGSVRIREEDVLEGKLTTFDGLRKRLRAGDNFESWSSMLIEHLDELLPLLQPVTT